MREISDTNVKEKLKLFNLSGCLNYQIGNLQASMENFLKSKELITKNNEIEKEFKHADIIIKNNIGVIQIHLGQVENAIDSFTSCLKKLTEKNLDHSFVQPLLNLGYL